MESKASEIRLRSLKIWIWSKDNGEMHKLIFTTPQMLLKNVPIRRGIAWLEPANTVLKGYQTEERQAVQDEDFIRGLRVRLG